MAIPGQPTNFLVQQANAEVLLTCDLMAGATTYTFQRSTDGVSFSTLATPASPLYVDDTVTVGVQYWYQVASTNGSGTSTYVTAQNVIPTNKGQMTLSQVRLLALQLADRVGTQFVTVPELNVYINQSYFELYDILVSAYGDEYYVASPYLLTTDGVTQQYTLPVDLYKVTGVDLSINPSTEAWVTLKHFNFIERNRYVFPQLTSTYLGVFNLRYRVVGNTLFFIPTPSANQTVRLWYVPKMTSLLQDTDMLDGISGWTEYVVVDVAMKILAKEESDTSVMTLRKQGLLDRIQSMSQNRDIGEPQTVSETRRWSELNGQWGMDGANGGN